MERAGVPGAVGGAVDLAALQLGQQLPAPEDYYTGAPPRIMGIEAETRPSAGCKVSKIQARTYMALGMPYFSGSTPSRTWLEWASIHDEVGEHIELRTPESLGPEEAVISTLVALRGFQKLLKGAYPVELPLRKDGPTPTTVYYHAGSFDHQDGPEGSYQRRGFHHSMMGPTPKPENPLRITSLLGSFKATASWAGAGALGPYGFLVMQKDGDAKYGASTADEKAALVSVHTVNNPQNDTVTPGYVRVEGRVGDALRSVVADFVEKAASSLILRVIEHQDVLGKEATLELGGAMLADRITGLKIVAGDLTLRAALRGLDGKMRTGMDIHEMLLTNARTVAGEVKLPDDEQAALDMWQHLIDLTRRTNPMTGDIKEASETLHWAYRMWYLTHKYNVDAFQLTGKNAKQNSSSLAMDLIYPVDPMAKFAARTAEGIITPEDIAFRGLGSPRGTRAEPRAEILRQHADSRYPLRIAQMTWNGIILEDGGVAVFDPYDTRIPNGVVRQPKPPKTR